MEKYKNEDYLKKQIMEQSRHLFVYGNSSNYRSLFIKSLEDDYPLAYDSNNPVALYFDDFGLPKLDYSSKDKDNYIIGAMSREYYSFTVAAKLLEKIVESDGRLERLERILNIVNGSRNLDYPDITSVKQLLVQVKASRDFYFNKYKEYISGAIDSVDIGKISLPFLQLETFVAITKDCIGLNSYLGLLLDKKVPIALSSTKEVNNYISSRINKDLSIKTIVGPNDWDNYYSTNGQFVEAVHDYGIVELDSSYTQSVNSFFNRK